MDLTLQRWHKWPCQDVPGTGRGFPALADFRCNMLQPVVVEKRYALTDIHVVQRDLQLTTEIPRRGLDKLLPLVAADMTDLTAASVRPSLRQWTTPEILDPGILPSIPLIHFSVPSSKKMCN